MHHCGVFFKNADSGTVGLGWNPRICISDKTPEAEDADGLQTSEKQGSR